MSGRQGQAHGGLAAINQTQDTITGVKQRRHAVHPVAAIGIGQAKMVMQGGNMEMPADDAVEATRARKINHLPLMAAPAIAQIIRRCQKPASNAAHLWVSKRQPRQERIEAAQAVVDQAAQPGHGMQADQAVVGLVAMHDKIALALRRVVNMRRDMARRQPGMTGRHARFSMARLLAAAQTAGA